MEIEKEQIDISGLDKAAVLAALYNHARPQGTGHLAYQAGPMSHGDAQKQLDRRDGRKYFDYLRGRVMKVDLTNDVVSVALYNRDNGPGLAQAIVAKLRNTEKENHE